MGRFLHPDRFLKQYFGGKETITASYFTQTGIFLHFWGLFEWKICEIILKNTRNPKIIEELEIWNVRDDHRRLRNIMSKHELNLKELKDVLDIVGKAKLAGLVVGNKKLLNIVKTGPKKLRDVIAHDSVSYQMNMGCYQPQSGWIKPDAGLEASKEYRGAIRRSGAFTDEGLKVNVYDAYTEEELREQTAILIKIIAELGEDIENHNVYRLLRKNGDI